MVLPARVLMKICMFGMVPTLALVGLEAKCDEGKHWEDGQEKGLRLTQDLVGAIDKVKIDLTRAEYAI